MLDAKLILSDSQLISSGSTSSTNVIDLGAHETALGEEENLRLKVVVSTDFTGGTSLTVKCREGSGTPPSNQWAESDDILVADLVAGYTIMDIGLPTTHGRYMDVLYTSVGTAGRVNAYIYTR